MGTTGAMGMADNVNEGLVSLDAALHWHLTSNHFPPVPTTMIPVAKAAIEALNDDDGDREIPLPEGIETRDGLTVLPAWRVSESLHLWSFVTPDDGNEDDYGFDGTEGQDRESYTDDQDRDSYVPDPEDIRGDR